LYVLRLKFDLFKIFSLYSINVFPAPHTCQQDAGGYWYDCDGKGCGTNAAWYENMMCPEDRCTINTNRPFRVSHSQNEGFINTWFSQEGRTANFDACAWDPDYIHNMAAQGPFDSGMVFTAQVHGNILLRRDLKK
jgi:hypothetical protein